MTRSLMFMGTGSDVGKSLIVAGLCRAYSNRGLRVAPFKPQNMSNNAAVTADGGEIGRAQALQAQAARREPITAMNPVLLKPEAEARSQLVVRGQRVDSLSARDYWQRRGSLMPDVLDAFNELTADADLGIVEGAGSASEVNLRHADIANFGFARAAGVPVVLIGDIDRGGVIASLIGTFNVIDPADAALIRATLVNKFRGDPTLFADGAAFIAGRTNVPCLGPIPFFEGASRLPAEDSLALDHPRPAGAGGVRVAVPRLPHIANFDDIDPLFADSGLTVTIVQPGHPIPQETDVIVLPGSKATRADLAALRQQGWDTDIIAHHRAGKRILGICGGYQMLGNTIADPAGVEGAAGTSQGLGLLNVDTIIGTTKILEHTTGTHLASGSPLRGYQMHMGETSGPDAERPFAELDGRSDGATDSGSQAHGTYMHGLFANDVFRSTFMNTSVHHAFANGVEEALDGLAHHLERHLDLDALLSLAEEL
jgi:adenosylcobyric acid synthase